METTERPALTPEELTLRDHVDARLILEQFLAEHEGELTPLLEALLRDQENATKEKIEQIAWFVKEEKGRIAGIEAMMDNLAKRKSGIVRRVDWLQKTYLLDQMQRLGLGAGESIKGTLSTVRLQLNNPRLDGEVPEERLVDMKIDPRLTDFVRYKPETYELDKVATLAALKVARELIATYDSNIDIATDPDAKPNRRAAAQAWLDERARVVAEGADDPITEARRVDEAFAELTIMRDLSVRIA